MMIMPYLCAAITCGVADGFEMLVRGVGRTGAPAPIIHDFCRAPNKVLRVALDESTSDRALCPSLSGAGRRIAQRVDRADMDVGIVSFQTRL